MNVTAYLDADFLVILAFAFSCTGFMIRDEMVMRLLISGAYLCYLVFYFTFSTGPVWIAILANGALLSINLALLGIILRERTTLGMAEETRALYRTFPTLNPGQFRRLLKAGQERIASGREALTTAGAAVPGLFLIVEGTAELHRKGGTFPIRQGHFVGEISFLIGGAASATVTAHDGTRYIFWERAALQRLLDRSPSLANGIGALFNRDLARKLSVSAPEEVV